MLGQAEHTLAGSCGVRKRPVGGKHPGLRKVEVCGGAPGLVAIRR